MACKFLVVDVFFFFFLVDVFLQLSHLKNSILSSEVHNVHYKISIMVFIVYPTSFVHSFSIFYAAMHTYTPFSNYILYQKIDWLLKKLDIKN